MQKKLIAFVLGLFATLAQAQTYSQPQTLQPKTNLWVINEATRLGATSRVKAVKQDPYPFCFSAAAALLWDQHRCMVDKKKCNDVSQTSFLAITPAGQHLPDDKINLKEGGSAYHSLKQIVDKGFVALDKCKHDPNLNIQGYEYTIPQIIKNWNRYKNYAPYLERAYRLQFTEAVKRANPQLSDDRIMNLLTSNVSPDRLMYELLLSESCFTDVQQDDRFKIQIKFINDTPKVAFNLIDQLLSKKIPVLVAFCLYDQPVNTCANRHTAIIVAKAKAVHKVTGDTRTYYWMVNTWGEEWQDKFSDGWIAADQLYNGIFGEVIWLDKR